MTRLEQIRAWNASVGEELQIRETCVRRECGKARSLPFLQCEEHARTESGKLLEAAAEQLKAWCENEVRRRMTDSMLAW